MRHFNIQLLDGDGAAVTATGGKVFVATSGTPRKASVKDVNGAAAANPVSIVTGLIEFYTDDAVATVDLYIQAPNGQFLVKKGVKASGPNEFVVNKANAYTVAIVPFSYVDQAGNATETPCGFIVPTGAAVLPAGVTVDVTAIDAGITIEAGTLSTDSGDADGYIDAVSVAVLGTKKGTIANGTATLGALLFVQDSANAGDRAPECDVSMSGKQLTYTLLTGADTAEGFLKLPMLLSQASM